MQKSVKRAPQHLARLLALLLSLMPLVQARPLQLLAQSTAASPGQEEDDAEKVTFDTLLPASSYLLYFEARDIGQHAHSGNFNEIIEPLAPMADQLPKEINSLVQFVAANADTLTRSRLMIAFQTARPQLPPMLIALELASADIAEGFAARLQTLLSLIGAGPTLAAPRPPSDSVAAASPPPAAAAGGNFKRAGRLLVFSVAPFTFKSLRGESDKRMSDDPNFRIAHDRFYAEPFFLYYDMALATRVMNERREEIKRQMEESEAETAKVNPATATAEMETVTPAPADEVTPDAVPETTDSTTKEAKHQAGTSAGAPATSAASAVHATAAARAPAKAKRSRGRRAGQQPAPTRATRPKASNKPPAEVVMRPTPPPEAMEERGPNLFDYLMRLVFMGRFNGESPADALGVALTLENDAIILRALMITPPGAASSPIPFLALPVSGPAQASEAATYLPADTDVFITASLDLGRLYEETVARAKAYEKMAMDTEDRAQDQGRESELETQIAAFEKANGIRVRDELLAAFSNEVAIGLPASYLSETPFGRVPLKSQVAQTGPVFLIGVRNRELLQTKLKSVLEALNMKKPADKGVIEKHGDFEIISYSQSAVAFINNYLVISTNAATVRRVIEARAKNETLATNRDFHSFMQWQPRETIAQVYVSGPVLNGLFRDPATRSESFDDETKAFLARYRFEPEPVTYAASAEGVGAAYELRLPKKLVMRVLSEISADEMRSRIPRNEMMVRSLVQLFGERQKGYKSTNGRYATLDELNGTRQSAEQSDHVVEFNPATNIAEILKSYGYKLELTVSGNGYEVTATPIEYGKKGKQSFYLDQSGVIRQGDHGGQPATVKDKPLPGGGDN